MQERVRAWLAVALATFAAVWSVHTQSPPAVPSPLYDAQPQHLWNRVHERLRVRTAADGSAWGLDTLDPLLWRDTRHLLSGPSHAGALRVLDEFLVTRGERMIRDPLKRAVFQHDLWAIFDWTVEGSERDSAARFALQQRLSAVMRRVALTRKEIEALPDTYAAAVAARIPALPPDVFDPAGRWVNAGGTQPLAPHHAGELSRSAFLVLWSLPGGAKPTASYLRELWTFPQPFVADRSFDWARDGEIRTTLNPALPRIPDGTRIALVRMMLLVDDAGAIVPTRIVQSVQVRSFPGQAFAEFKMSRNALFRGTAGGLRAVAQDERDFLTFSAKGDDQLENQRWRGLSGFPRVLELCSSCHHDPQFAPPVTTVHSLGVMLRQAAFADPRHERWARWFTQSIVAAEAKSRRYDWGVLHALWQAAGQ